MKRSIGLPNDQLTSTLLSRLQQFNRYLLYLPGTGSKFDAADIREMVYNALPGYVHTIIATADYKWFDENKTDSEVIAYIDRLLIIGSVARGEKPKPNKQPHVHKRHENTKFKFNKHNNNYKNDKFKKGKPKCTFCGHMGHEDSQCRFKQKASAEMQKRTKFKFDPQENNVIDIADFSDEFEHLDELPEMQEFMDNMNAEVGTKNLPTTKVK